MTTQLTAPAATDDEIISHRARVYRLFATLFGREITASDLAVLRQLTGQIEETAESDDLARRLSALAGCLPAEGDADGLLTVRAEFAALFLGSGGPPTASPYESTYRGEHRLFGSAAAEIQDLLAAHRLAAPPTLGPADHVAVELSLMAALIDDGVSQASQLLLGERLLSWVPALTARVQEAGRLPIYPALAQALLAFLQGDVAHLSVSPEGR